MSNKEYLQKMLELYELEDELCVDDLLPYVQTAIGMKKEEKDCVIGTSKFGGEPDLPAGTSFPEYNGNPLSFLCQINLSDLSSYESAKQLPSDGLLSFFFEALELPFIEKKNDYNSWHVFFFKSTEQLERTSYPVVERNIEEEFQPFPEYAVKFQEIWTLKENEDELDLSEEAADCYLDFAYSLPQSLHYTSDELEKIDEIDEELPYHFLLGYPQNVQEDVIEEITYTHSNVIRKEVDPDDYTLLLQLDFDEDLEYIWGDMGKVYFIIKKEDLKNQNFSEVLATWQCH